MRLAVAALLLTLTSPVPVCGESLAETIRRIKPSIVGISAFDPLRSPSIHMVGTGFIVGDGHQVLTNEHVVRPFSNLRGQAYLAVVRGTGADVRPHRAHVIESDPARDLTLLRFDGEAGPALALDSQDLVEEGREIAFTGYPLGSVYGFHPVTHRGIIAAVTPIAIPQRSTRLLDSSMLKRLRSGFAVYQLDATAYPGNSGSPVYDPVSGRVLGIVGSVFVKTSKEKVLSDPSGITFAIPIRFAREMLDRAAPGAEAQPPGESRAPAPKGAGAPGEEP